MGTSSEVWRLVEFPFAMLQILVNLQNYELGEQAYIIDHQYRQNTLRS